MGTLTWPAQAHEAIARARRRRSVHPVQALIPAYRPARPPRMLAPDATHLIVTTAAH
jgi:hypothetical protein